MEAQAERRSAKSATFTLPWPPSVNNYFYQRVVMKPGRKPYVQTGPGTRGKHYRKQVLAAILDRFGFIDPVDFRVRVAIVAFAPTRRKWDVDNILKPLLDALTHAGFWADDSLVDDLRIIRGPIDRPDGKLEITVEEIQQDTLF